MARVHKKALLLVPCILCPAVLVMARRPATRPAWPVVRQTVRSRYPTVPQLRTAQPAYWLAQPDTVRPCLLDVRTPAEYAVSHLRGAALVADEEAARAALQHRPGDAPVVLYCSVGLRSADMAEKLQNAGFAQVHNLEGSIFQWANDDRPVYRGAEQVRSVHVYGEPWLRLLKPQLRATVP